MSYSREAVKKIISEICKRVVKKDTLSIENIISVSDETKKMIKKIDSFSDSKCHKKLKELVFSILTRESGSLISIAKEDRRGHLYRLVEIVFSEKNFSHLSYLDKGRIESSIINMSSAMYILERNFEEGSFNKETNLSIENRIGFCFLQLDSFIIIDLEGKTNIYDSFFETLKEKIL